MKREPEEKTIRKNPPMSLHERADFYNASNTRPKHLGEVQWLVRGGELVLDWVRDEKGMILER